ETYVSCSECGRPICTECMTSAPVGQRCPEHSGKAQGLGRVRSGARRTAFEGTGALVTKALIGANVLVYVITAAQGAGLNSLGGQALGLIVINLVLSFAFAHISYGGHIGGLIGGALCTLVLSRFGRGHAAYSRIGLWGIAGVLGVGLLSIAVAYLRVRGYAS